MKRMAIVWGVLALVLAVPVAAGAQSEPTVDQGDSRLAEAPADFDEAQERVLEAVDKRVEALDRALIEVAESEYLTADHAATLTADYEFHRAGLLELRPEIEAATTGEELRVLAEQVWKEHWVFALQIPKGRLTHGADVILHATSQASDVADQFDEALDELAASGVDIEQGERLLNELRDHISSAAGRAAPVPDLVLAIDVTEMPDAGSTLQQSRDDILIARDRMHDARDAAHELADFIRSSMDA